nr:exodeoxyribonuclease VII large subunit [Muribaculaceae bacterium]
PWRIAVISAKGAAGYGDFITHLYNNPSRLRFSTTLFPAILQGESAPMSIISALEEVASQIDDFDCVVIIRGGGATGDLASFDNYDLAANVAQFPLPVIVGIGHERDVTILDYVAAVRVKTPTAAAEWLIGRVGSAYDKVRDIAGEIFRVATSIVSGGLRQLAYYDGLMPTLVLGKIERERVKIGSSVPDTIRHSTEAIVRRHNDRLNSVQQLISALSPQSVLKRGYSITRVNGRAISDVSALKPGDIVETRLATGSYKSSVTQINQ